MFDSFSTFCGQPSKGGSPAVENLVNYAGPLPGRRAAGNGATANETDDLAHFGFPRSIGLTAKQG
jgi:hypothetical protein